MPHLPQRVGGNGHDAFWALLRGKAGGVLQSFVGQRSQVKARLVGVTEPGATGHGQNLSEQEESVMLTNQSQTVNRAPKTHKIFNKSAGPQRQEVPG